MKTPLCQKCGRTGPGLALGPCNDCLTADLRAEIERLRAENKALRAQIPDDRKALPSETDRSQLRCTAEEAQLLREQLARIGMAKP